MTGYSNGQSFGAGREPRRPVPGWKFGIGLNEDRGSI